MSRPIDEQVWHRLTAEIMSGMRAWRVAHPKATLREMEQELDHRWVRVRACLLEDMALASVAADWTTTPAGQQPTCPACGVPLQPRGTDTRTLQPHGGQDVILERQYGSCSACGAGLFPPR
jgi:YgiT-type zinc finger domain-containing protein